VTRGLDVLGEESPLLVVAKPAGVPVFPPHADPAGDCVLHRLFAARPSQSELAWPKGFAGGIAHRLDVSTSGQLWVATTVEGLEAIREDFRERRLSKTYRFITARDVPWDTHTVDHRLAHDRRRKSRMVYERGRNTPHRGAWHAAETRFTRIGRVGGGLWAWKAVMRTGLMHQIRVHAAACGLALAGDRLYGGGELAWRRPDGVRFLLHHLGAQSRSRKPAAAPVPTFWPGADGPWPG
jgi:23S rRNA-/tRNA-specific pseudouridylate synthase